MILSQIGLKLIPKRLFIFNGPDQTPMIRLVSSTPVFNIVIHIDVQIDIFRITQVKVKLVLIEIIWFLLIISIGISQVISF